MPATTPQTRSGSLRRAPWLALLASFAFAASASATMTLDLVWTEKNDSPIADGSSVIEAIPGDVITVDIIATVDAAGVDSYQVSLEFDLNGLDELDLEETIELEHIAKLPCDPLIEEQLGSDPNECFGMGFGNELTNRNEGIEVEDESVGTATGLAGGFEARAPFLDCCFGIVDLSFRVGRVRFLVTDNIATNGADLEATLILESPSVDGYTPFDFFQDPTVRPGDLPNPAFTPGFATVNVPEPGSTLLAAMALGAVVLLRRSTRRSRSTLGVVAGSRT